MTVISVGVIQDGERALVGLRVGANEEKAFWLSFLRSLVRRGLSGVKLVIGDAHQRLKLAVYSVLAGAAWQRCRVGFMRNMLSYIRKSDKAMVAAAVHTMFTQPNRNAADQQLHHVAETLTPPCPSTA